MKTTLQAATVSTQEVDIKETLITLPSGTPAVDLSINGLVFARIEVCTQPVGSTVKLIAKLHIPEKPTKKIDPAKIDTEIHAFQTLIEIGSISNVKPEKPQV